MSPTDDAGRVLTYHDSGIANDRCSGCGFSLYAHECPTAHPSPAAAPRPGDFETMSVGCEMGRHAPMGCDGCSCACHLPSAPAPQSLRDALEAVTDRRDCGHGRVDVMHVAPSHFLGRACPECSDARYADEVQDREPCVICAALDAPALTVEPDTALTLERLRDAIDAIDDPADTNRLWRAMSSQQLAIAILRALGEGAGEGVDRG
ncbi:MAG TPA: hypothetical protein VGK17_02870 [Propionicimonas sp.]|jgi:hypothetical protein